MISGAKKLVDVCKKKISQNQNELSENKTCSWTEVECLGACVNAPMMQINEDYFEDLDKEKTEKIVDMILNDRSPKHGSYKNRRNSEPISGRTTLINSKDA
jgi:NADH-quinone oxidoreductase subunit E